MMMDQGDIVWGDGDFSGSRIRKKSPSVKPVKGANIGLAQTKQM